LFTDSDSTEVYDNRFLPEGLLLTESRARRLSSDEILFGTDKGLLSMKPERMKRDSHASNLIYIVPVVKAFQTVGVLYLIGEFHVQRLIIDAK